MDEMILYWQLILKNHFEILENNFIKLLLFIVANWGEGYRGSVTRHSEWSGSQSQRPGGHRGVPTGQFYWSACQTRLNNFLLLSMAPCRMGWLLFTCIMVILYSHFCKTFYLLLYWFLDCRFYVIKSSRYSKTVNFIKIHASPMKSMLQFACYRMIN